MQNGHLKIFTTIFNNMYVYIYVLIYICICVTMRISIYLVEPVCKRPLHPDQCCPDIEGGLSLDIKDEILSTWIFFRTWHGIINHIGH